MGHSIRSKVVISKVIAAIAICLLFATDAWAAGAETGWTAGAIFGLVVATGVMYRIHPILGIITLLAGLANLGRMFP